MATTAHVSGYTNLGDYANAQDKDGMVAKSIDQIKQVAPLVADVNHMVCNNGTRHDTTLVTGYSQGQWTKYYSGPVPTKGSTTQVTDVTATIEGENIIDKKLYDKQKDGKGYRFLQNQMKVSGISEQVAAAFWYADPLTDPTLPRGISPRYSEYSYAEASLDNKLINYNVLSAGGTTDSQQASVWLIGHGFDGLSAIHPEGAVGGLKHEPKGLERLDALDGSGGTYYGIVDRYMWDTGLIVENWQRCGRVCNIDMVALAAGTNVGTVIDQLLDLIDRVKRGNTKQRIYMPRRVKTLLEKGIRNGAYDSMRFGTGEWDKQTVQTINDIPVAVDDFLLTNENDLPQASA